MEISLLREKRENNFVPELVVSGWGKNKGQTNIDTESDERFVEKES